MSQQQVRRQASLAHCGHAGFFKTGVDQFGREHFGETGEIIGAALAMASMASLNCMDLTESVCLTWEGLMVNL